MQTPSAGIGGFTLPRRGFDRPTSEKALEKRGTAWIKSQGGYVVKGGGQAGTPDRLGCIEGRFFAIEWKNERGRVSDLQKRQIRLIENAGGAVLVTYDVEEMKQFITTLRRGT